MKKRVVVPLLIGVLLLTVSVSVYFIFRHRAIPEAAQPVDVNAMFLNNPVVLSPDAANLGRVIRGTVLEEKFAENQLWISTQLNWPESQPTMNIVYELMPTSEFLCWQDGFTTGDGSYALYSDTIFLLSDDRKLQEATQTILTKDEAATKLNPGTPVVIALNEAYHQNGINKAFQIAIVGCQ